MPHLTPVRMIALSVCLSASFAAGHPFCFCHAQDSRPDLPQHELVFAQHADDTRRDYDIWRMCADGTQIASLVVLPGHQSQFSVSPDGSEIVYSTRTDDSADLWRRSFNGGEPRQLTQGSGRNTGPVWSPDGKTIAFFSDRDAEKPELYLLTLDSGEVRRLTHDEFYDSGAAWDPDGMTIVFTRYFPGDTGTGHDGHGEIMRLNTTDGDITQLTELQGYNGGLTVSPGGGQIAFHRVADERVEIWIMNSDGSNAHALTDTFIDEYSPAWSPDGHWIAFTAGTQHDGRGTFDLYLMRSDGSDRRVISTAANTQMEPQWRRGDHRCR